MIVLPTGEVMLTDFSGDVELYTPNAEITPSAVPVITSAPVPVGDAAQPFDVTPVATLIAGQTYKLEADRINGISQGAYYGDDLQAYTNDPVVRITNGATGHVRYCKTHDHQHRKIGPATHGSTQFDVPADLDPGPARSRRSRTASRRRRSRSTSAEELLHDREILLAHAPARAQRT